MSQIVFYGSAEQCKHYEEELGKAIKAAYPDLPWERWEAEKQAKEMEEKKWREEEVSGEELEAAKRKFQEMYQESPDKDERRPRGTNRTPPKKKRKKR